MTKPVRIALWIFCGAIAASLLLALGCLLLPIRTPLWAQMTQNQVLAVMPRETTYVHLFEGDPSCVQRVFHLGEWFEHETWVHLHFDDQSRLQTATGHHTTSLHLPVIGLLSFDFPKRDIHLPPPPP